MRSRIDLDTQDVDADIDMTPMLDIVFIMLIFFIVSTTFVRESGIDITRPSAESAESKQNTGVMVAISADNNIWIDRQLTDVRMIRPTLERLSVEQPDLSVMVQADEDSKTGLLVKVLDQIRLSGITNYAVSASTDTQ